jgi:release factor glutamine methyltransferase
MTVGEWLMAARQRIDALDARLLLQWVSGVTHATLIAAPETPLDPADRARLDALLARRAAGEPYAYLVGEAVFRGRRFAVSPAVLVPRPETEELVDRAHEKLGAQGLAAPRILDLGTGSGVLAISLACESPTARVVAVDISAAALAVARANGERLSVAVDWRQGDWFAALAANETFALIVANPPYIAAADPHLAGDGLRHEPRAALTDEADGLTCLRAIVAGSPAHLQPGGWLIFEHGCDQGEAARQLLLAAGFAKVHTAADLGGHPRFSLGQKPASSA